MRFLILLLLLPLVSGCTNCSADFSKKSENDAKNDVTVFNWNCQTFFDSVKDGNEYSDYQKSKNWNTEKYSNRIEKLCSVIKEADCDIVVLEEIEKKEQLIDITNVMAGTFNFDALYRYGCFTREENSSIGIGVLSRYPLLEVKNHQIDFRADISNPQNKQPSLRAVSEITVLAEKKTLKIFANHWKSKASGEKESEIWRKRQENVLASIMEKSMKDGNENNLALGDFNTDINEFTKIYGEKKKLANIYLGKNNLMVKNPWFNDDSTIMDGGSYFYDGGWEKIDHFFTCGKISIEYFSTFEKCGIVTEDGRPYSYKLWNGEGFSDHLPIICRVRLY